MKKEFYNDNIERLLKEKSDEFKMFPSKRIWYSIYNDLHPSKKWPSISMCLFLIVIIGVLGYLNTSPTHSSHFSSVATISDNKNTTFALNTINKKSTDKTNIYNLPITNNNTSSSISTSLINKKNVTPTKNLTVKISQRLYYDIENIETKNITAIQDRAVINTQKITNPNTNDTLLSSLMNEKKPAALISFTKTEQKESTDVYLSDIAMPVKKLAAISQAKIINAIASSTVSHLSEDDKSWIDNYAFLNKPKSNLFKDRMLYELYATPSINFRKLSVNSNYYGNNNLNNIIDIDKSVKHYASFGVETGIAMIYPLTKKIRIKSGLQFNYTNYAVSAFETNHPVATTLMMNDPNTDYSYLESRISTLANVSNPPFSKLHNKTYQLSAPLGADLKIASTSKFDWYIGATIQPTYIFAGNAYLISSDRKNYIHDQSLMRKFNLNTAVETFLSYTTPNKIRLQFGPQYRYQLNSTYKKYSVSENLYQLGVKFGVVKMF